MQWSMISERRQQQHESRNVSFHYGTPRSNAYRGWLEYPSVRRSRRTWSGRSSSADSQATEIASALCAITQFQSTRARHPGPVSYTFTRWRYQTEWCELFWPYWAKILPHDPSTIADLPWKFRNHRYNRVSVIFLADTLQTNKFTNTGDRKQCLTSCSRVE